MITSVLPRAIKNNVSLEPEGFRKPHTAVSLDCTTKNFDKTVCGKITVLVERGPC